MHLSSGELAPRIIATLGYGPSSCCQSSAKNGEYVCVCVLRAVEHKLGRELDSRAVKFVCQNMANYEWGDENSLRGRGGVNDMRRLLTPGTSHEDEREAGEGTEHRAHVWGTSIGFRSGVDDRIRLLTPQTSRA